MDKSTLLRFVEVECGGDTKEAAERLGVSVSYILKVAPELRTAQQSAFDDKVDRFGMPYYGQT